MLTHQLASAVDEPIDDTDLDEGVQAAPDGGDEEVDDVEGRDQDVETGAGFAGSLAGQA